MLHLFWMKRRWSRFFLDFVGFPLIITIPSLLHTNLLTATEVCDSPDRQHIIRSPVCGSFICDPTLGWFSSSVVFLIACIGQHGQWLISELKGLLDALHWVIDLFALRFSRVARFNIFSPCYVEFKTYPTSHWRILFFAQNDRHFCTVRK